MSQMSWRSLLGVVIFAIFAVPVRAQSDENIEEKPENPKRAKKVVKAPRDKKFRPKDAEKESDGQVEKQGDDGKDIEKDVAKDEAGAPKQAEQKQPGKGSHGIDKSERDKQKLQKSIERQLGKKDAVFVVATTGSMVDSNKKNGDKAKGANGPARIEYHVLKGRAEAARFLVEFVTGTSSRDKEAKDRSPPANRDWRLLRTFDAKNAQDADLFIAQLKEGDEAQKRYIDELNKPAPKGGGRRGNRPN